MPVMTHDQVVKQHLQRLLQNERVLVAEARRIEHGLDTIRAQIANERRTLAHYSNEPGAMASKVAA